MSSDYFYLDSDRKFNLADGVLLQRFEDNALLLDLESERVYQLNETGARIAELLSKGCTFSRILALLKNTYAATPNDLEIQVKHLIGELVAKGLVIQEAA